MGSEVWRALTRCDMSSVSVAWPRWVMIGLNGCEIVSLGVHRV